MKKIKSRNIVSLGLGLLVLGCASAVPFKESNVTTAGIKVAIGKQDNVHVNDKIVLLEQKCKSGPKVPLCSFHEVGKLTIKSVHDGYSVVTPDEDLIFKQGQYFKFAMHCDGEGNECQKTDENHSRK